MNTLEMAFKMGLVLVAEGYLFELARRGLLSRGHFVPEVVLDFPDAVRELHREFARTGSDVVEALTYYAHEEKMKTAGRMHDLEAINRQAVRLAREVADEYDLLTAGNICNTGVYDPDMAEKTGEEVRRMYRDQVSWAVDEGVDFIIAETIDHLGEALIAHEVISEFGLPSVVTFATHPDRHGRDLTLDGVSFWSACKAVSDAGALVVGLNCSRGPATMLPLLRKVRNVVNGHVAALPIPYRTTKEQPTFWELSSVSHKRHKAFPENLDPHLLDLTEVASFAKKARDLGIDYIGLCCGASPEQFRTLAETLGRMTPSSRYRTDMSKHYVWGESVKTFNKRSHTPFA